MGTGRIMVFVNMKRDAEKVEDYLKINGIDAEAISGDVPQKKRMNMLKRFQSGELAVLIGTDVASRGLHIPTFSTSSTMTCRRTVKIMSTASAERHVQAHLVMR